MFLLDSPDALVAAFRPRDRAALELPEARFPLFVRDYLAWTHPSGVHVYLLFRPETGVPTGIAFQRDESVPEPSVAHLCEWCHTFGTSHSVGLLTADRHSRKRVGVYLCRDLACARKLEDAANRGGKSVLEQQRQLVARMARFATEALGVDLSGGGREGAGSARS